jgi:hypothetical protein
LYERRTQPILALKLFACCIGFHLQKKGER